MDGRPRNLLNRRQAMLLLAATALAGPAVAQSRRITADEAHAAAKRGDLLLIDIRSRQEWLNTGVGKTAVPLSMHEPGFFGGLETLVDGDRTRPIALICASGSRSSRMRNLLEQAGYATVLDVSEGMLGGPNGKGWIPSGLPVKPFTP